MLLEKENEHKSNIAEKGAMHNLCVATDQLVICFDYQNVVSLPHNDVSSFFYKQKLTLYNLTSHASISKKGYITIWTEAMSSREGNDIASAFVTILSKVVNDFSPVSDIIVWSDSCVLQNRNQVISFAVTYFLALFYPWSFWSSRR